MTSSMRLTVIPCVALLCAILASCGIGRPAIRVRVGVPPLEQNALLYIAADRRLFAHYGIDLQIRDYDSGPTSIAAMESGKVDVAETAEFPFVEGAMNGEEIRIIAANDRFENDYLVARRDRGIKHIQDLTGKRIGVTLRTITQFYLERFLRLHGIGPQEVTLVNVQPSKFAESLRDGKVDALVAWQPNVSHITRGRTGSFEVWPVQSSQPVYGLLVCTSGWLGAHEKAVKGFLASLAEAEDFLVRHPRESRTIVAKRLDYSDSYLSSVWPDHEFTLTLDFSLVAAMEDEARWVVANNLSQTSVVPDFGTYLYLGALAAVRPDGVNMMR
jgi:NitT/TauT family transport system substrate-binding protein